MLAVIDGNLAAASPGWYMEVMGTVQTAHSCMHAQVPSARVMIMAAQAACERWCIEVHENRTDCLQLHAPWNAWCSHDVQGSAGCM